MAASPASFGMFKRAANGEGATWGSSLDAADAVTDASSVGSVEFTSGSNLTSFGQFSFGYSSSPLPVELLTFDAAPHGDNDALLTWTWPPRSTSTATKRSIRSRASPLKT